jgi:hypothetical protein
MALTNCVTHNGPQQMQYSIKRTHLSTISNRWCMAQVRAFILCVTLPFLGGIGLSNVAWPQQTKVLQHLWEIDPPLPDTWQVNYPDPPINFSLKTIHSPIAEDRINVAQELCRVASNPNFVERELAVEMLLDRLEKGEENLQIRRAMISAVCLLGDSNSAATLWDLSQSDRVAQATVERALIRWKSPVAVEAWRQRLENPIAQNSQLLTALEGLAAVGSESDAKDLLNVMIDSRFSSAYKFYAASAIGNLIHSGHNELVQNILDSTVDQRHLLAALILRRHSGATTIQQLQFILESGPTSAQVVAYSRIAELDTDVALNHAPSMLGCDDANLRKLAIEVLHRRVDEANLLLQAQSLGDRNPTVRRAAREKLLHSALHGHRESVDAIISQSIVSEKWTELEQAILISVALNDSTRCKNLLPLLDNPRPEVNMLAGWALMELADDPSVLEEMLKHAQSLTDQLSSGTILATTDFIRLSYLHESFGKNKYLPANDMLLEYIPKNGFKMGIVSRASAMWALGKIHQNEDNPTLRDRLHERITDISPIMSEDLLVRFTCVLACGEMGQLPTLEVIEQYCGDYNDPLAQASNWARDRIRSNAAASPN